MAEKKPESCPSNCAGCEKDCSARDLHLPQGPFSAVKHVVGIASGKGGVGKSSVTSLLATAMQSAGFACGILDADVTGPSIPHAFGLTGTAKADEMGLQPRKTKTGIAVMSVNLLLEQTDAPVVWRGPVISGVIQQFWQEVAWGELDFLFVDLPPGTGDVPLTVYQQLPLDGVLLVATPQDLVGMIVRKAYHMAQKMDVPVLGLIENMSYAICPHCYETHAVFGEGGLDLFASENGLPLLARLPLDGKTAKLMDQGAVELADTKPLQGAVDMLRARFVE